MGLPMAALLAQAGHDVVGVDINPQVVDDVNLGRCPFLETGMPDLVRDAHASGRLRAVLGGEGLRERMGPALPTTYVLSLPTPVNHATHVADMAYVRAGVASITPLLKPDDVVILESTSPLGATRADVQAPIDAARPDLAGKVHYVFCPERAIPGNTLHEMTHNDRLVGGLTADATARGVALYQSFCKGAVMACRAEEAEMVKLVENASRDVQIAFANELSLVCDTLGLDVRRVIELANHHPRVNILQPGPGVGGHCIAVDPWFIIQHAKDITPLMQAARGVNDGKPAWVVEKTLAAVAALGKRDAVVACLGLAYKPNVDDLRESPSIEVVRGLVKLSAAQGFRVVVSEPHLDRWEIPLTPFTDAVAQADVVVVLTGHAVFAGLPDGALAGKDVLDTVGFFRTRTDGNRVVC